MNLASLRLLLSSFTSNISLALNIWIALFMKSTHEDPFVPCIAIIAGAHPYGGTPNKAIFLAPQLYKVQYQEKENCQETHMIRLKRSDEYHIEKILKNIYQ